jgi:hypothetical protein
MTISTNLAVTGNTTISGTLGVTGVTTFAAGTALLPALTTSGDTNTGVWFPSADTIAASTAGAERMRISSAGYVGIGNTAPASLLTVGGGITSIATSSPYVELMRTGQSHWKIQHLNNSLGIQNAWTGGTYRSALVLEDGLGISTQELLRLGYFGGVGAIGIGISAPTAKLTVANGTSSTTQHNYGTYTDASNYDRIAIITNSTAAYLQTQRAGTGTARPLVLGTNSLERMRIDAGGLITACNSMTVTKNLIVSGNTIISGSTTTAGDLTDSIGNVRDLVNSDKVAAYVLVATDNGKLINITTGGVTVNISIFSAGNNITIYNNSASSQTITQGTSVTMYLAGTATTGNRTLAQRGICTIVCVSAGVFVISGTGLT